VRVCPLQHPFERTPDRARARTHTLAAGEGEACSLPQVGRAFDDGGVHSNIRSMIIQKRQKKKKKMRRRKKKKKEKQRKKKRRKKKKRKEKSKKKKRRKKKKRWKKKTGAGPS